MFAKQSNIVWFFIFIHVSNCERRIQDGQLVKAEKPYVVYFVKAPISKTGYDTWLCGGALVKSDFVVTSAACIKDVDFLYVIAGYNKYVTDQEIENDRCTSKMKKKVIYTCYPEDYILRYDRLDKWSLIDIGVAKVESPYDFTDQSYKTLCSYIPGTIPVNFEAKNQQAGMDAIVLGWGHQFDWRQPEDTNNHNQEYLNYAPVMILDKKECKHHYEKHGRMTDVIDGYMICTLEKGHIDDKGEPIPYVGPDGEILITEMVQGCDNKRRSLSFDPEADFQDCEYNDDNDDDDQTRRDLKKSSNDSVVKGTSKKNVNETTAQTQRTIASNKANLTNITARSNIKTSANGLILTNTTKRTFVNDKIHKFNKTVRDTRRYGICQNDHGGPLVTWVGTHEVLIGVASVFKVSSSSKCEGPFLYTSTQCNGAFLDCILETAKFDSDTFRRSSSHNVTVNISRRSFCRKPSDDVKHPTTERHISWLYHPAGAADHEKHLVNNRNEPSSNEKTSVRNVKTETSINPMNKMINTNDRYPPLENNPNLDNNAPNSKYVVSENTTSNINQRGASNNKDVAYSQYPPSNIPRMTNDKFYGIPASISRPVLPNGPTVNNAGPFDYNPAQMIDNPARNEPEINFKSERVNVLEQNNRPELNLRSGQANNFALNSKPVINTESERNSDHAQANGPVQNIGPTQAKELVQSNLSPYNNNLPAQYSSLVTNKPKPKNTDAATKKLQIIQNISVKVMMRPTIRPRI